MFVAIFRTIRGFANTFLEFYDIPKDSKVGQKLNMEMKTGRFGLEAFNE